MLIHSQNEKRPMATKKDTSNLITQPPSGDSEEDIGIEDKENDQIAPELRQSIEKVQIDPPNNAIEGAIPVVKVGWFNPATAAGFEPVASSDFFGPVTTTLIAPLLT